MAANGTPVGADRRPSGEGLLAQLARIPPRAGGLLMTDGGAGRSDPAADVEGVTEANHGHGTSGGEELQGRNLGARGRRSAPRRDPTQMSPVGEQAGRVSGRQARGGAAARMASSGDRTPEAARGEAIDLVFEEHLVDGVSDGHLEGAGAGGGSDGSDHPVTPRVSEDDVARRR